MTNMQISAHTQKRQMSTATPGDKADMALWKRVFGSVCAVT